MPQILNRYTSLDRPRYNLPIGPLAMRGLRGRYATMNSFSTGPVPIAYPLKGIGMGPPSQLYGGAYYHREPIRLGRLGEGTVAVATTTTPAPTTGAQSNTSVYTMEPAQQSSSFWDGSSGRVTLAAGGFLAGYLLHCLIYRKH